MAHRIRPSFHIEPLEPGDPVPNVAQLVGASGSAGGMELSGLHPGSAPIFRTLYPDRRARHGDAILCGGGRSEPRFTCQPLGAVLDLELQNIFSTKYPEIRSSGFINPGAPRTLRAALRFADHE